MGSFKNTLKNIIFPGNDLHCLSRAQLCRFWRNDPRRVLNAGSGNGFFSWLAYRSRAEVVASDTAGQQEVTDKIQQEGQTFKAGQNADLKPQLVSLFQNSFYRH